MRTAVYALIFEGQTVYVGCSKSPDKRLKQHRATRPQGEAITLKVLSWHKDSGHAYQKEYRLIRKLSPPWNVIYSPAVLAAKLTKRQAQEWAEWQALAAKNQAEMDAANAEYYRLTGEQQ